MNIECIHDQDMWNLFVLQTNGSFIQSWEWGEILRKEGKNVERLAMMHNQEVVAVASVVYSKVFFWDYAFCGKGPVISRKSIKFVKSEGDEEDQMMYYDELSKYLREKKCLFFRVEPSQPLHTSSRFQKSKDINPRATTCIDLLQSEEALLEAMHQKTRYNIRLAEKKGVVVDSTKNIDVFMKLMQETGKRDGFRLHDRKHYEYILYSPLAHQLTVQHEGSPVAVGVFVGFGNTFTYLYGASDYTARSLMSPYLVQWEGMKLGKKLGYAYYDFFGIAPTKRDERGEYSYDQKHQYAGVTRFKLGFGGALKEDPGTFDIVLNSTGYKLYIILRTLRRFF